MTSRTTPRRPRPSSRARPAARHRRRRVPRTPHPRESARTRRLLAALEQGDLREVRAALQTGVDPNREIRGETPFVRALTRRQGPERLAGLVRALIEAGAIPRLPRRLAPAQRAQARAALRELLRDAIRFDDVEGVQVALAAGADPNARDASGVSMLIWAVQGTLNRPPRIQVLRLLLAAGARTAPRPGELWSALCVAASVQRARAVAVLLEAGAAVDEGGACGLSPLGAALCRARVTASARRLIDAGASFDPAHVEWASSYRTFRAVCAMVATGEIACERLIPFFSASDPILREGAFAAVGQRPR